jgi:hypothetical protein
MALLAEWSRELVQAARTADHPFNAGLMMEGPGLQGAGGADLGQSRQSRALGHAAGLVKISGVNLAICAARLPQEFCYPL